MNPFPPPRAYIDGIVPRRKDGTMLTCTNNESDYDFYISWLADYLYENEIPVPECQMALSGFPCFIPSEFDPLALENVENMIEEGRTYAEYLAEMTKRCGDYCMEMKCEFPDSDEGDEDINRKFFLDVCVASEEQFNRVVKEIEERKRSGITSEISHADIPYRAVFARTLKEFPTHDERVSALRAFYGQLSRELDEVYGK